MRIPGIARRRTAPQPSAAWATIKPQPNPVRPSKSAAGGARREPGKFVAAINAVKEEASEPNVTDQA
jgi:hypothetical protein